MCVVNIKIVTSEIIAHSILHLLPMAFGVNINFVQTLKTVLTFLSGLPFGRSRWWCESVVDEVLPHVAQHVADWLPKSLEVKVRHLVLRHPPVMKKERSQSLAPCNKTSKQSVRTIFRPGCGVENQRQRDEGKQGVCCVHWRWS